ncbi:MAG TPA: Hsp20/alpha crystallin family protein [Rhodothermales bacterium]|nr:Hsp20/alpha crystallin family protein [Rhodothermales bacterium]
MANMIRFSPARDFARLQREIDDLFNSFLPAQADGNGTDRNAVWSPRADFVETSDAYVVHYDVPGMNRDDLEINFHDGMLTVSGERAFESKEEEQNLVRVERHHGRFFRSFAIPKQVDPENIQANYENGVLTVRLPKAEESKPRRISVS